MPIRILLILNILENNYLRNLWEKYIVHLKEKERHAFVGMALFIVV